MCLLTRPLSSWGGRKVEMVGEVDRAQPEHHHRACDEHVLCASPLGHTPSRYELMYSLQCPCKVGTIIIPTS